MLSECNLLIDFRRFPENSQVVQKIMGKGTKGRKLRSSFSPPVIFYGLSLLSKII
jgi:hypothetical protein